MGYYPSCPCLRTWLSLTVFGLPISRIMTWRFRLFMPCQARHINILRLCLDFFSRAWICTTQVNKYLQYICIRTLNNFQSQIWISWIFHMIIPSYYIHTLILWKKKCDSKLIMTASFIHGMKYVVMFINLYDIVN